MKNKRGRILAYALVIVMAVTFLLPAIGSETEKQVPGSQDQAIETEGVLSGSEDQTASSESDLTGQTESEGLAASLEDTGEAISEVISKGYDLSLDIKITEAMQNFLSDITKGTDMSWAGGASFTGASAGNEDGGIDLSGTIALNGEDLYDGRASVDVDHQRLYLVCPQFRKKPFVLDLKKAAAAAEKAAKDALKTSGKKGGSGKAGKDSGSDGTSGNFKVDYKRLASEGVEFFSSISEEELKEFAARYAGAAKDNYQVSAHENVMVTAGALSESIETATITVPQDSMLKILTASRETLKEDPLIRKILESDFAVDVANTIVSETKLGSLFEADTLYSGYGDLLSKADDGMLAMVPGFSLTYGMDSEGRLATVNTQILYAGASADLFTLSMLSRDTHFSAQFDLGGLVSAYLAHAVGGSSSGETGLVLEADNAGGKIEDSITVVAAGQELGKLTAEDFMEDDLKKGILNGTLTLDVKDMNFQAEFASQEAGTVSITGRYNGTDYLTIEASAKATDHAKVEKIKRKQAMEVYDQATWDEYIKDAKLTKMIRSLSKGGVPDSIVEMLTSGEAMTEKSRENTVENDGTGDPENGEVAGADIGKN